MNYLSVILLAWSSIFQTIQQDESGKQVNPKNLPATSIEGAWELHATESGGVTTIHKKPKQIKIYSDGHACLIHYDEDGKFEFASAGTYQADGNIIREKATYHTQNFWLGVTLEAEWSLSSNGDTLFIAGPKKVVLGDGRDITKDIRQRKEIKVRVKI